MKKFYLFLLFCLSASGVWSQSNDPIPVMRRIFHENIDKAQITVDKLDRKEDKFLFAGSDETENKRISDILYKDVDALQVNIERDSTLDNNKKIKYLRGLGEVLAEFESRVRHRKMQAKEFANVVNAYKSAKQLEAKGSSIVPVINEYNPEVGDVILKNNAFQGNPGLAKSRDLVLLKYCERDPSRILPLLAKNPNVYFADSLIKILAYTHQDDLYTYAQSTNTPLGRKIHSVNDPLVKIISKLAVMKDSLGQYTGQLYFPFLNDLYNGKTTLEELQKSMGDDNKYFRLLVNTQIDYAERLKRNDTPMAMQSLTYRLRKKAVDVFINQINGLHEESDASRFKVLEPLNPQELYYLCVMGEDDIYTSSYLGVYKRIFQKMKNPQSDSLLASVNYDYFKKFIKIAANYNTLDDFLKRMSKNTADTLMRSFAANLDKTKTLEDAVDVADSYASISDTAIKSLIMNEINVNYTRVKKTADQRGILIYDLLDNILESLDSTKRIDISAKFGIPPVFTVDNKSLRDTSGRIVVQQFFYGDKDGIGIFNNFKSVYSNSNWKVINKQDWIEVVSTKGTPVTIYANKPFDTEKDLDAKAQEALGAYLYENDLQPTVVIHRGHSYYVKYTIDQLAPSAKVVLLGSCGGYHALNDVLQICPFAHIIASKQVGSGTVNQPMLIAITERLRQGRDLDWPAMWKEFAVRFNSNDKFEDYVPPHKNLGAIFIMAYNKTMNKDKSYTSVHNVGL